MKKREPTFKPLYGYLRYSGLGLQMLITLLSFVLLGMWLDKQTGWCRPCFTIVFSLIAIIGSLIWLIKQLNKPT